MNTEESEVIILVGSVLSYIGIFFVMFTYFYVESLRKIPAFRIIFQIALADLYYVTVGVVNMFYASEAGGEECEIMGFVAEHAALVASTWAFYFAYTMYGVFTMKFRNIRELKEKFVRHALIAWLVPLLFAVVPLFFTGGYGYSFLYCWISETLPTELYYTLIVTLLYLPMGVQMVLMMVYYGKIYSAFKSSADNSETKRLIIELMFYPVGVLLNYLVSGLDRFVNVGLGLNFLWFSYFHFFIKQSQGFINAVVYGYSSKVRELIRNEKSNKAGDSIISLNASLEMNRFSTPSKSSGNKKSLVGVF